MNNNTFLQKLQVVSLPNKYTKWYSAIINSALDRNAPRKELTKILGPVEHHHILPKSFNLGGIKNKENLVYLTTREHYVCHRLLTKMVDKEHKRKMCSAVWRMAQRKTRSSPYVTSRAYAEIRNAFIQSKIGTKTGRTSADFTPEWRAKLSKSRLGKSTWNKGLGRTSEEKEKISATRKVRSSDPTWNLRPPCSEEKAAKIQKANLGKKWAHHKESLQRKYLSPHDFLSYIANGWEPGLGKF